LVCDAVGGWCNAKTQCYYILAVKRIGDCLSMAPTQPAAIRHIRFAGVLLQELGGRASREGFTASHRSRIRLRHLFSERLCHWL